MLEKFPFAGVGIAAAIMAADGVVASHDISSWATNKANTTPVAGASPPLLKSKALYVQGAAVLLGLAGELAGWNPEYTEPALMAGVGLLAREGAFHLAQSRQTAPVSTQGYAAPVSAPAGFHAAQHALARPDSVGRPGRLQPVTAAG